MNRKRRELIITNDRICNFYENNPSFHIEKINMYFVDLFETIITDITSQSCKDKLNSYLYDFQKENTTISFVDEISKINIIKEEYLQDMFSFIEINFENNTNNNVNKENLFQTMETKTIIFINQIRLVIKSSFETPEQNDQYCCLETAFQKDLFIEIKNAFLSLYKKKEWMDNIKNKTTLFLNDLHKIIFSFQQNVLFQEKMMNQMTNILSILQKGLNENKNMMTILNKLYSTSDVSKINQSTMMFSRHFIEDSNHQKREPPQMFLLKRPNKYNILIESMDIERNVNNDEIHQFIQTMEDNNCNGVFLSQRSGFLSKLNYHIEIYNKLIIVYVHNVGYNEDKVKNAMDIIDNLTIKLREFNREENINETMIETQILEEINKEYQVFIQQKENMISSFKENQKKILNQMEDIHFPELDKFLLTKFSIPVQKQGFKCELCKKFNANNLKALAAHKRGCFRKISKKNNELVCKINEKLLV